MKKNHEDEELTKTGRRIGEKQKSNRSKNAYRLDQSTVLEVIKPVSDSFRKSVYYRTYHLIKKSEKYDDSVAQELHCNDEKDGRAGGGQDILRKGSHV